MSHAAPQIFKNISPAQFELLTEKAQHAGISISGNSGLTNKMGVEVSWDYSPETQELTLECLKAPFFVSVDEVNEKIRDMVTQSLASV